jgi:hypothetical protein
VIGPRPGHGLVARRIWSPAEIGGAVVVAYRAVLAEGAALDVLVLEARECPAELVVPVEGRGHLIQHFARSSSGCEEAGGVGR